MRRYSGCTADRRPNSLLVLLFFVCASGCAATGPLIIPPEARIPVSLELKDLTGTGADSLLPPAVTSELSNDLVYVVRPVERDAVHQYPWRLDIAPNPLRSPSANPDAQGIRIRGDVERADYGPVASMRDVLSGYTLFGLFGASLILDSEANRFATALQYRFSVTYAGTSTQILVRVAREFEVDSGSRAATTKMVTQDAARVLLMDLVDLLNARKAVKIKVARYEDYDEQRLYRKAREILYRSRK